MSLDLTVAKKRIKQRSPRDESMPNTPVQAEGEYAQLDTPKSSKRRKRRDTFAYPVSNFHNVKVETEEEVM
jgi:hypothetical protein